MSGAEPADDGMRAEYDSSPGVRGKYAGRFAKGTNLVLLASDVAAAFGDGASVNRALHTFLKIAPGRRPVRARRHPVSFALLLPLRPLVGEQARDHAVAVQPNAFS